VLKNIIIRNDEEFEKYIPTETQVNVQYKETERKLGQSKAAKSHLIRS